MLHRFSKAFYHTAVYMIGISVLLAAVAVTTVRILLPDIGMYRSEVEAWVSEYMGYPIAIRSIDASWEGWVPHLYLQDIVLLSSSDNSELTSFESANISIAPLATILERRFIPRQLIVSGFHISATRQKDGSIYIQGIRIDEALQRGEENQTSGELAEWLFRQNRIEIQNGRIEWHDEKHDQESILLRNVQLLLRSDQERLQVEGSARLPDKYGEILDFALDTRGDLMSSDWSGELYLRGENINPDNWYTQYRPFDLNTRGGTASVKVWSTWDDASLTSLEAQLNYDNFQLLADTVSLDVSKINYDLTARKCPDSRWCLTMDINEFSTKNGEWPEAGIELTVTPLPDTTAHRYSATFDYLKLDDLAPFFKMMSFLPDGTRSRISNLGVRGNLLNGSLVYSSADGQHRSLDFDIYFENLRTDLDNDSFKVLDLSGHVFGSLTKGLVKFAGDSAAVYASNISQDPITINQIDGQIDWSSDSDGYAFNSRLLSLATNDFMARLSGAIRIPRDSPPYLDIIAEVDEAELIKLTDYIPDINDFKMREWMERSVLSGVLTSGRALIRGDTTNFPFREGDGQFKIQANIKQGALRYASDWPELRNIEVDIRLDGKRLSGLFQHANIYNATFKSGRLQIPDVFRHQKWLEMEGLIEGQIADLNGFIGNSPLTQEPRLEAASKALEQGRFTLDTQLRIPLHMSGNQPGMSGRLTLKDVSVSSEASRLELAKVNGDINFTRERISAGGLTADFKGLPVDLNIKSSRTGVVNTTSMTITGHADANFIADTVQAHLPGLLLDNATVRSHLSGETDWQAVLEYRNNDDSNSLSRSLTVSSNLQGLAIDLPEPLTKVVDEIKRVRIHRNLVQSGASEIEFDYGPSLKSRFFINESDSQEPLRASIHFGNQAVPVADDGIHITGDTDRLSIDDWWNLLQEFSGSNEISIGNLASVKVNVGNLSILSQVFRDASLSLKNTPGEWNIDVDSENIKGSISLPQTDLRSGTARIDLDRLFLKQIDTTKHSQLDAGALPSIYATIGHFIYDEKDLGEVQLEALSTENGLRFDTITFNKPGLMISGTGNWYTLPHTDQSSFNIVAEANQIDTMIRTFGYDGTNIRNGETRLQINADWAGTPMQFDLEKLNGDISMSISNGQLLDVEPSAGRLFGLLSIQALPRRLTLDFSDLFSKGLTFDRIEGNFVVSKGNAYTNNLFMRGPAIDIAVSGRTGLSSRDYDQRVTVTPQMTESLPVAGAIFGPVGIGIGAIFYLAGEMFESLRNDIDSLLRYRYTITGSWENPVVEKVNPSNAVSG